MNAIRKAYIFITAITCALSHNTHASDAPKLYVETIKHSFTIPFSDDMTIEQIKKTIQESEGIPVGQQLLQKKEWVRKGMILPSQIALTLENDKTCRDYDLCNGSKVQLFLQTLQK